MKSTTKPFPITQLAADRNLRVYREPCYADARKADKEWYLELRGERGTLYGNNADSFWVHTTPRRLSAFAAADPREVRQGDNEVELLYEIDQLDAVLALLRPRKRKNLTPEQRAAIADRLLASRKPTQGRA